ncbi:respirasome Complex Assembly Factor 1 [Chrysoperla carnea]|uniref:respirasome Complex Assembly Factor 1 n=1 Tax=Chrysoperla carnea TaxID=189513 RepID=UPI001D085755|nr:respirasome Complex Assembly Factor 1 [Chrysoperla carnea]
MTTKTKLKTVEKNGSVKIPKVESIWHKCITSNSEWPDKEEFLDVIYWARQAMGIILGVAWGLIPLKGFVAILLFVLVNAGIIYFYCTSFQCVDEDDYGGAWELTKEGFMTSFAGFLVTWIIIYSGLNYDNHSV